jgi:hypothetical protein
MPFAPEVTNALEEQRLIALGRAERAKTEPATAGQNLLKKADAVRANRFAAARLEHAIVSGVLNPDAIKAIHAEIKRLEGKIQNGKQMLLTMRSRGQLAPVYGEKYVQRLQGEVDTLEQHVSALKTAVGTRPKQVRKTGKTSRIKRRVRKR